MRIQEGLVRIAVACAVWWSAAATAATFNVNSNADTASPPAGTITLRSALGAAEASGGANTINLPAALGPYVLSQGALATNNAAHNVLTIQGTGGRAVVDGNNASGVFNLQKGAIALSSLTIRNGNIAITSPGAYGVCTGPGVFVGPNANVTIENGVITNNQTSKGSGGGICVYGGNGSSLTLTNSLVANNTAEFGGGGLRMQTDANVHITNSTFYGNMLTNNTASGGGIETQGTLTLTQSTLSVNYAVVGSALAHESSAVTTISNTTIAGNDSTAGGTQLSHGATTDLTIVSSIIANPTRGTNCARFSTGRIVSNGHNLESGSSCGFGASELTNVDPVLGVLADNGGPTPTMMLLAGSPGIDRGANPLGLVNDQRGAGYPRTLKDGVDVGAFESPIAPALEGRVVEYVNTIDFPGSPGGHFFYTADPAEQVAVDAGAAGHFTRTGRSFGTGGLFSVCRFYGSVTPGPNSHFFTAGQAECDALRALQRVPTPATVQQWNYEGLGFNVTPPVARLTGGVGCPAGTAAVFRGYNNAFTGAAKNPWDSNHRFSLLLADITALVDANNWKAEGTVFCALP